MVHVSPNSIISVYWAAWNSSEFVIPQRRYDLWLLLLPVRILYNIPEQNLNTPFIHSLSHVDKRRGENRILYFFLTISPSSLSFMFIFAAWINACVMVLVYMIASLKESFCVLFCVFRNFRCELDLNFCKNLLSKHSKFCSIIIMHLNGQQLEVKTLFFFCIRFYFLCRFCVKTAHYVSQSWVKELIFVFLLTIQGTSIQVRPVCR